MTTCTAPPDYRPLQRAFHAAFDTELTATVDGLPLRPDARVLDVPCGDGFFSRRLARRLTGGGRVIGIDGNVDALARARRAACGESVEFQRGDAYALPCGDAAFDFALCAMSFISLDDPVRALGEVRRALVPGGRVAVLESDEFHHVLLPWPVDLEVAVQRAVRDACGGRLSPARRLNRMLRAAGFGPPRKATIAADRQAPFPPAVARFLWRHLVFLRDLVRPHLATAELRRFDRFADPTAAGSLFRRADAEITCLMTLHQARRPA
ncbi:MAG: methyltransferase domain-containing protein [Gemmataceae bacterium]